MGQMEFKDNRMEIERANNKQLLEEIKYIVVSSKFFAIFTLLIVHLKSILSSVCLFVCLFVLLLLFHIAILNISMIENGC